MMTVFNLPFVSMVLLIVLAGGCAPSPTILHPDFGQSVTEFKEAQILNPAAQGSEEPVEGFQGVAADTTVKQYEKSFTQKRRSSRFGSILLTPGGPGGLGGQGGQTSN